jgi:hypothetical protein
MFPFRKRQKEFPYRLIPPTAYRISTLMTEAIDILIFCFNAVYLKQ